ncbi:MAG: polysaccharide biosynthesis/export family protein [Nitrospirota bacterium]
MYKRYLFLTVMWFLSILFYLSSCSYNLEVAGKNIGDSGLEIEDIIVADYPKKIDIMLTTKNISSYTSFMLSNPLRIVLDINGIVGGAYKDKIDVPEGIVKRISLTKVKGKEPFTRVNIFISQLVIYNIIKRDKKTIVVEITKPEVNKNIAVNFPIQKKGGGKRQDYIPENYVVGPEDVLEILVWKNQELSKVVTVRPDGKISLPLIGEIKTAGLTPARIRDEIADRLSKYKEVPEVSVIVQQVNSYVVYLMGEVIKPGRYQLKNNITLIQAITLAGGFTPFASKNDIIVLRREIGKGMEQRIKIRYDDIIYGKDLARNIILQPGDTIIVP